MWISFAYGSMKASCGRFGRTYVHSRSFFIEVELEGQKMVLETIETSIPFVAYVCLD